MQLWLSLISNENNLNLIVSFLMRLNNDQISDQTNYEISIV